MVQSQQRVLLKTQTTELHVPFSFPCELQLRSHQLSELIICIMEHLKIASNLSWHFLPSMVRNASNCTTLIAYLSSS